MFLYKFRKIWQIAVFTGGLPLILKFKIVNIYSIAVFNAHFLQSGEQAALAKLKVKIVSGFIIIEVDVLDQTLQPCSGDQPGAAQMFDYMQTAGST